MNNRNNCVNNITSYLLFTIASLSVPIIYCLNDLQKYIKLAHFESTINNSLCNINRNKNTSTCMNKIFTFSCIIVFHYFRIYSIFLNEQLNNNLVSHIKFAVAKSLRDITFKSCEFKPIINYYTMTLVLET